MRDVVRRGYSPLGFVLTLCACASGARAPRDAPMAPVASPWVGVWLVDEPSHAEYAASEYRFAADGALSLGRSLDTVRRSIGAPSAPVEVGVVEHAGVRCRFGARWREDTQHVAYIEGACDDGRAREIALRLPSGAVSTARAYITLVDVGGEDGWAHPRWEWSFRRCSADARGRCAELDP